MQDYRFNLSSPEEIERDIRGHSGEVTTEVKKLEELIKSLPKEIRIEVFGLMFSVEEDTSWKDPLPPPEKLKEYNDAVPDGAERILQIAEKQSDHRILMERQTTIEDQRQSRNGQNFAFIIALAFLFVSGILIWEGKEAAGTVLGTVDLVALCTAFILGRNKKSKSFN